MTTLLGILIFLIILIIIIQKKDTFIGENNLFDNNVGIYLPKNEIIFYQTS